MRRSTTTSGRTPTDLAEEGFEWRDLPALSVLFDSASAERGGLVGENDVPYRGAVDVAHRSKPLEEMTISSCLAVLSATNPVELISFSA